MALFKENILKNWLLGNSLSKKLKLFHSTEKGRNSEKLTKTARPFSATKKVKSWQNGF